MGCSCRAARPWVDLGLLRLNLGARSAVVFKDVRLGAVVKRHLRLPLALTRLFKLFLPARPSPPLPLPNLDPGPFASYPHLSRRAFASPR